MLRSARVASVRACAFKVMYGVHLLGRSLGSMHCCAFESICSLDMPASCCILWSAAVCKIISCTLMLIC